MIRMLSVHTNFNNETNGICYITVVANIMGMWIRLERYVKNFHVPL